jgi:hypothetical protein
MTQWSDQLLRMKLVGEYEPSDVIDAFRSAESDPKSPAQFALLVDVTRSEAMKRRSAEEIRHVAEALGPFADRIGRRCAVIAPAGLLFGLSRMGSVYSGAVGVDAQIFKDEASALEWLGLAARTSDSGLE